MITYYVPGDTTESRVLVSELNQLAARHGYYARSGPTAGCGAFSRLMVGIADKDVILVKRPDVTGVAGLRAFVADHPDQEWAKELLKQVL